MDILSAHRHGLGEQLDGEVQSLAGRWQDHGQRAVVLHHLYDHSRGQLGWALAEARSALRIAAAADLLVRRTGRWAWLRGNGADAGAAVDTLLEAIGEQARARCIRIHRAYRLTSTPALRPIAEQQLPGELIESFDRCHGARRGYGGGAGDRLFDLCEELAKDCGEPDRIAAAWSEIARTSAGASALRLLGERTRAKAAARDRKLGWDRVERALRSDTALPAAFRANPAQYFYALQQRLAERRRTLWSQTCDGVPDAFEIAA
ncbi:hypothetical protein [Sphingomonas xanthus]|uniref:Uncharacterized protein n=1 Tax=Sphingomonas xanthus TaxID=2594473 RepID=A0A516ITL1_9SPHN|nr:hypothetical protein [Sphingomonas xanthus]QDP20217.1 hypothetical protein FMM02_09790 [Sphingomonas xanthus]